MAAQVVQRLPEGDDWIYELKFDGYRALILKGLPSFCRVRWEAACVPAFRSLWTWFPARPRRVGRYTPTPWGPPIDRHAGRA